MTTASQTYTVQFSDDAEDRDYPWLVIHPDGDRLDQFATQGEAEQDASERQAERDAEEQAERLSDLRDEIARLMDDCEREDLLGHIKALLKG